MSDDLLLVLGRKQRADLEASSESAGELDELDRPFAADERAELLDALFERVPEGPSVEASSEPSVESSVEASVEPSTGEAEVVPLRPRRRFALVTSLLAAAAAAALVWWAWPGDLDRGPVVASVPAYSFTQLRGGVAGSRSDPDEPKVGPDALPELELHPDSAIDWVLTPAEPTRGPVGVALHARSKAGEVRFVGRLEVEVTKEGAVAVRGPISSYVDLTPGEWTLTLLLAAPEDLPTEASQIGDGPARWRSLTVRVIIVADE